MQRYVQRLGEISKQAQTLMKTKKFWPKCFSIDFSLINLRIRELLHQLSLFTKLVFVVLKQGVKEFSQMKI
ncbi:CLUMA_CG014804, isoform A [Clunio marinus]|uniref:CLUMA_CG014804, isoform A n=1 Tax=Clunio marinus TaxID=568069 RepID=A0A1J1ILT4_9DIPT|nr:CLUMA_CG014804, isoform A [Clunio marinus]